MTRFEFNSSQDILLSAGWEVWAIKSLKTCLKKSGGTGNGITSPEWTLPKVVVIESNASKTRVARLRAHGGLVVIGDATDQQLLSTVGVLKARRIVLVTGSDESNAEIIFDCVNLMRSAGLSGPRDYKLECYVQITDPAVLKPFNARWSQFIPALPIDLRVFNPAASCARQMIESDALALRPTSRDEVGLLILVGFGKIGQSIALQIAELAHFENGKRQRLLIIENDIQDVASRFTAQFGSFTHADCICNSYNDVVFDPVDDSWNSRNLRPVEAERVNQPGAEYICNALFIESPRHYSDRTFLELLFRVIANNQVKPVVLVCRDQDRENFEIASMVADGLHHRLPNFLPIFAWLPKQTASGTFSRQPNCRMMRITSSSRSVVQSQFRCRT